jgi:dTMP kinase
MAKSLFIEGLDGSGKSTQIKLLEKYLKDQNIPVVTMREPGGSDYYEAIRREIHFNEKLKRPPISDALLAGAGRASNIEETKAALEKGLWVISDRAYPSTFAYQVAQGNDWEVVAFINKLALGGFKYDLSILLDIPVTVAKERLSKAGDKLDFWESMSDKFFEKARENYLKVAEQDGLIVLDGTKNIEELHKEIISLI